MAVAYDIKAIPTVYGARQFRSRLEAKWASFFDLCGWQFEYEPFDLGAWSPDFLLIGEDKVLVEVKPITDIDTDVTAKMITAARAMNWDGELLLLGAAPVFEMGHGPYESPALGWLGEWENEEEEGVSWWFERASACMVGAGVADFMHADFSYHGRMTGTRFKDAHWPDTSTWLKRLWDQAANRVQWHKK